MVRSSKGAAGAWLWSGLVAGSLLIGQGTAAERSESEATPTHHHPKVSAELPASARSYYQNLWGVDILGVKPVSSGAMLRFSYRVVDASKAKVLNDKTSTPVLIDQKSGASLVIPTMEKVGQLRQTSTPEKGREYWMLFSNKGDLVRPGSRVNLVIGHFRAEGLIVQSE
jgi:hypothetical protein